MTCIRSASKSRARQLREYAKLKREFLRTHDECFACKDEIHLPNRELHHWLGRTGRLLTWKPGFRMACKGCHAFIHKYPAHAWSLGLLGPRGCWNDFKRAIAHHEQQQKEQHAKDN